MRPIVLNAGSPYEIFLNQKAASDAWRAFLKNGTNHSERASTLPYIIRRCEREGVSYQLTAHPGQGYFIKRIKSL